VIGRRIASGSRAIGVITPSSNRTVERVTNDILALAPDVDACFARVPYFGDGQGQPPDRYDEVPFLAAAEALEQARVDALCWCATRGMALGLAHDRTLSERLQRHTGLPVVTTALAALDALSCFGVGRIALVTQGTAAQGGAFKRGFTDHGVETRAELHLGLTDNFAASRVGPERIADFVKASVTQGGVDAALIWGTNLPGHGFAGQLERELNLPVLDSAAIGVWAALRAINVDTRPVASLGRLFSQT
jgi:maleate isomerase